MYHEPYPQFVFLSFLGLGLVLAAVVNLAMRRSAIPSRILATFAAGGATVAACMAFERDATLLAPLGAALGVAYAVSILLAGSLPGRVATFLRQPLLVWRGLCLLGVGVIIVSAMRYEDAERQETARDTAEVESLDDLELRTNRTSLRLAAVRTTTDTGAAVELYETDEFRSDEEQARIEDEHFRRDRSRDAVMRRGPADDRTNCFGWVFAGGRHWVKPADVERILNENGYRDVDEARRDDVVVYRNHGRITHVAVVRYVSPGQPVLVEGKWGSGGVYLHAVNQSEYGKDFRFMRSPRAGHLLNGLRTDEPPLEERTE